MSLSRSWYRHPGLQQNRKVVIGSLIFLIVGLGMWLPLKLCYQDFISNVTCPQTSLDLVYCVLTWNKFVSICKVCSVWAETLANVRLRVSNILASGTSMITVNTDAVTTYLKYKSHEMCHTCVAKSRQWKLSSPKLRIIYVAEFSGSILWS